MDQFLGYSQILNNALAPITCVLRVPGPLIGKPRSGITFCHVSLSALADQSVGPCCSYFRYFTLYRATLTGPFHTPAATPRARDDTSVLGPAAADRPRPQRRHRSCDTCPAPGETKRPPLVPLLDPLSDDVMMAAVMTVVGGI